MRSPSTTATPRSTPLGRLDARAKIVLMLAYSVAAFLVGSPVGLAALGAVLVAAIAAGRLRLRQVFGTGVALYVLVAFIVVLNGLQGPEGWHAGLMVGARMLLVLWMSYVVCLSSTSTQLQQAFASLLRPLAPLRVPVDDVALTLSLALRLIPQVSATFSQVAAAQRSRCAHLDDGGPARRAQAWGAVFAPTLVALFRHAGQLGEALDARCYGVRGPDGAPVARTQLARACWRGSDTACLLAMLAVFSLCVAFL